MTLFCFGDSITYGNWDPKGGWVGRLRDYLDSKSLSASSGNDLYSKFYTLTYNLGIPGDTSSGLLERFETELAFRFNPDEETVILFAIGINDSRFYPKESEFETELGIFQQNIWDLWEIAKKYTADVAFLGLTPVDESRTNPLFWDAESKYKQSLKTSADNNEASVYKNEYIEKYNLILKQFCESRTTPFIDIYEHMKNMDLKALTEDGLHPNSEGYKVMEEIIRREIFEGKK